MTDVTSTVPVSSIQGAVQELCRVLMGSQRHPVCWRRMTEDTLWRELVACTLGSRVRFDIARSALERLDSAELLSAQRRSSRFDEYERDISCTLKPAAASSTARSHTCYPFPQLRARHIRAAAERIYGRGATIRELLGTAGDFRETRRLLNAEVAGLGPKQASLFLRNIGYTAHVAILDVHVLTYMNWVGLTPTWTKAVRTLREYEVLEDAFIEHSFSLGHSPDRVDLAVWVVVRVAKQRMARWR